jgi:hypothetical protein
MVITQRLELSLRVRSTRLRSHGMPASIIDEHLLRTLLA